MTKVNIERPTQTEFKKISPGRLFEHQGSVYIKSNITHATAIYKTIGHMNAGQLQEFEEDCVIQYITEFTVKVG